MYVYMQVCVHVCVHTSECTGECSSEGRVRGRCIPVYHLFPCIIHYACEHGCVVSLPGRHTHQGQQREGHLCTAGEQTDREVQRGQVPTTVYIVFSPLIDKISLLVTFCAVGVHTCTQTVH